MKIKEIVIQIADDYELKLSLEQARELKQKLDELLEPTRITVAPSLPWPWRYEPFVPCITTTDVTVRSIES